MLIDQNEDGIIEVVGFDGSIKGVIKDTISLGKVIVDSTVHYGTGINAGTCQRCQREQPGCDCYL